MNGADGRRGTRSSARAATAAGIAGVGVVGICIAWLAMPASVPRGHTTTVQLDAPIPGGASTTTLVVHADDEVAADVTVAGSTSTASLPSTRHQSYLAASMTSAPPASNGTPAPTVLAVLAPTSTIGAQTTASAEAELPSVVLPTTTSSPTTSTALSTTTTQLTTTTHDQKHSTTTVATTLPTTTTPTVTLPPTTVDTVAPTNPTQDAPSSQEISQ